MADKNNPPVPPPEEAQPMPQEWADAMLESERTPPAATLAATGEGVPCVNCTDAQQCAAYTRGQQSGRRAALAQPAPVAAPAPAASEEDARIRAADHERNLSAQAWATLRPPMTRITGVSSGVLERAARRASPSTPEPAAAEAALHCRRCNMMGRDTDTQGRPRCTYCGIENPDAPEPAAASGALAWWADGTLLEPLTADEVLRFMNRTVGPRNMATARILARYWKTHPAVAAPTSGGESVDAAWLRELLRRSMGYVKAASISRYDGTDGASMRASAASLFAKIESALQATPPQAGKGEV